MEPTADQAMSDVLRAIQDWRDAAGDDRTRWRLEDVSAPLRSALATLRRVVRLEALDEAEALVRAKGFGEEHGCCELTCDEAADAIAALRGNG